MLGFFININCIRYNYGVVITYYFLTQCYIKNHHHQESSNES